MDAKNNEISSTDLADGNQGYDKLNFSPETTQRYKIVISPFKKGNVPNGEINIFIKKYSTKELEGIKKSSLAAKEENNKDIMTLDIKHFWEAFDQLKDCRNFKDSVQIIQTVYLDRATDGLKNFQKVKDFSAEKFVHKIHQYKKFYNSVRKNTYVANELDISDHSLLDRFKKIYPEAKGFKVCFIIGPVSDGATISGNYLLLGTELLSGDANSDTSEFTNANFKADFSKIKTTDDLKLKLEEVAAHESVHTQQQPRNKDAVICNLLDLAIREGVAEFIAQKILDRPFKPKNYEIYGIAHEKELWIEFKSELCNASLKNWIANNGTSTDRPADLGYLIGYKIAASYYDMMPDKKQAIKEMITMDNPLLFLDKSRYDIKFR
ncbi:hypothetical protein FK004_12575 [Flavobacterium kingsejongi]|uniref:Uncharacterized protein n=1 Tax=Flavobacterium kingsejongi TaxID=1678728 RepID=A0A2S1LQH2_9FLAO|nr:hypothetical protein FK004_12575 [Flavobacterium kingsejongi]